MGIGEGVAINMQIGRQTRQPPWGVVGGWVGFLVLNKYIYKYK